MDEQTQQPMSAPESDRKDIEENKFMATVSYLPVLCVLVLMSRKDSAFAQYHARQGTVLFIVWVILWVGNIIPVLGWIVWFFGSIALFILMVMGMGNAWAGKRVELPVVGKYAKEIKL